MITPEKLKDVKAWILLANDQQDIREAIANKWPDEAPSDLIREACAEILEAGRQDPDFVRGWVLESSREMVRKMIEVGDYSNALKGLKQIFDMAKQ